MKNKTKGFTLVETLLIIGLVSLVTIIIYQQYSKKYTQYLVDKQAQYVEQILIGLQNQFNTISDTDTVGGTAAITAAVSPPTNLITERIIPNEMIRTATTVKTLWDGNVTFSGQNIPLVIAGPLRPQYEITLNNIPQDACTNLAGHSRIVKSAQRIMVNGIVIKNPGVNFADSAGVSMACNNATNVIRVSTSPFKAGVEAIVSTGATAALRAKEGKYYIAPPGRNAITGGGPVCSGGTTWNAVNATCVCGVGFVWNGASCVAFGTPGICPLGQGWDLTTSTCIALPFGVSVTGVQQAGRYIPVNITTPAQLTTSKITACSVANKPASAVTATNPAGNFDGSVCQKCILTGGSWNVDRCVAP